MVLSAEEKMLSTENNNPPNRAHSDHVFIFSKMARR
jgi:hypothetical protein